MPIPTKGKGEASPLHLKSVGPFGIAWVQAPMKLMSRLEALDVVKLGKAVKICVGLMRYFDSL